jgi:hypothetical protein
MYKLIYCYSEKNEFCSYHPIHFVWFESLSYLPLDIGLPNILFILCTNCRTWTQIVIPCLVVRLPISLLVCVNSRQLNRFCLPVGIAKFLNWCCLCYKVQKNESITRMSCLFAHMIELLTSFMKCVMCLHDLILDFTGHIQSLPYMKLNWITDFLRNGSFYK